MSPLEIGLHALKAVPLEKGGRGKKGGLSEYATKIGKKQPHVSDYRQAAEVFTAIRETYTSVYEFLDKAQHLAAIHKAPADCWPCLAAALVEAGWNVADTEAVVAEVVKAAGRIAPCRGTLPLLTPSRTTLPRR